ncbi:TlpA disulfide reductase family protein [Sphingobacterium sp.]|uniref:TlpA family protein disulfide reductase n=1 Tax=Sphingobacterium sp. TaxID=341027 RepID=UPI0028A6B83B|nr:TlpA disulfide reductase family protein [Sphingobacterium sp.]
MVPFLPLCNNLKNSDKPLEKNNIGLLQDTIGGRAGSGLVNEEIIPDLKSIYLLGAKGDDNIRFLDTTRNLSNDSIKLNYKAVNDFNIESFKRKKISEDLLRRVELVNMGFREYLWYKILRDSYPKNDRSLIAILIRDGQSTTIHPRLLLEQLEQYPAEYRATEEWKELKRRLLGKDATGYSLAEHGDYKMITSRGEKISIKELANGRNPYTLIVFTASWCAPCHVQYEMFKKDFDHLVTKNVRLISYSLDERVERWKNLLQKKNYISECYCDQQGFRSPFVKDLAINSIPAYVLLDKQGIVLKKVAGNPQEMFNYVKGRMEQEKEL